MNALIFRARIDSAEFEDKLLNPGPGSIETPIHLQLRLTEAPRKGEDSVVGPSLANFLEDLVVAPGVVRYVEVTLRPLQGRAEAD